MCTPLLIYSRSFSWMLSITLHVISGVIADTAVIASLSACRNMARRLYTCAFKYPQEIVPYIFVENRLKVTVNLDRYRHMIENFLWPNINRYLLEIMKRESLRFTRRSHSSHFVMFTDNLERVISWKSSLFPRKHHVKAPKVIRFITLWFFFIFFWGHLKAQVYNHRLTFNIT